MILFIHIPKTAGTSFRIGLKKIFRKNSLMLDYGPDAPETDASIRNLYLQKAFDAQRILEMAMANNAEVICGHFPLSRYQKVFSEAEVISFVREPLQRCFSEYLHYQRHKGYNYSFKVFFQQKSQVNIQSNFLAGLPRNGILGCSEYYEQSLELIYKTIGLPVPSLKLNCNRKKLQLSYNMDVIGAENTDLFYRLNAQDVHLYEQVKRRFFSSDWNPVFQKIRNLRARFLAFPIFRSHR